jgi:hypothetical protein
MNEYGILQLGIDTNRNKSLTTVTGYHTATDNLDPRFPLSENKPGTRLSEQTRNNISPSPHSNFSVAEEKPLGEIRTAGLAQPTTTIFDPIQSLHFFSGLCPKSFIPSTFRQLRLPW